ncbi:MAG: hypothetical protein GY820_42710, partial [Gammaproteobacteria bacterium]|nr:hypothetical protein [Gammaproteobacteria bacterium]
MNLWHSIEDALGNIVLQRDRHVPYSPTYMLEAVTNALKVVIPQKQQVRLLGAIDRIERIVQRGYRTPAPNLGQYGEELKFLPGSKEKNPLYNKHLQNRCEYNAISKFHNVHNPQFKYTTVQKEFTSPVMSSIDLVAMASTKGIVKFPTSPFAEDAQKLMNGYFSLFASSPGKLVLTHIYDCRTLADGLRDLKDQAQFNNGKLMVSLTLITYQGPVGEEPYYGYELQTPLHHEAETRLRILNWAIP